MPTTTALTALALRALRPAERTTAGQTLVAALAGRGLASGNVGLTELLVGVGNDPERWRRWRVADGVLAVGGGDALSIAALLVVLGPELGMSRRRLVAAGMEGDLADSELVEALLTALEALPSALVDGAAAWLVRRVDAAARRAARRQRRATERSAPLEEAADVPSEDDDPALVVSTLLAEAAAAGVVTWRQAAVVHAVRVADQAVLEHARVTRRSPQAVQRELNRAEAALRAYLASSDVEPVR